MSNSALPNSSKQSEAMFRSSVIEMTGYVPGEQPQGGKFIKLNTNENPYPASPNVRSAIEQSIDSLQRYPDPLATTFRLQAAEVYDVSPDSILTGNGSDDLLTILTRAFVNEGGTIWYPRPSYVLYRTLARLQGANYHEFAFQDDWTLPSMPLDERDPPQLVFVPNPNSPSGTVIRHEQIIEWAEQLPCPLVVDEAYADFADTNAIELVKSHPNLVITRTLSKSYALAGLRFGFLIAQPSVVDQLRKVKDSYNCDALAISAAAAAVADQDWFVANRDKVLATRERLTNALRALSFTVIQSQANFVWCQHPSFSALDLYEQLKANKILVRYMNYQGWGQGLRVSVGTDEQIDAFLVILEQLLRSLTGEM